MTRFPVELSAMLRPARKKDLTSLAPRREFTGVGGTPFVLMRDPCAANTAAAYTSLLERRMFGHMRRMISPIPPKLIQELEINYSETLPKTMRVWSAELNGTRTTAQKVAREIGLTTMLRSRSLRNLAERTTGLTLNADCSTQLICYTDGDYSGPHNDHHPEEEHLRNGYVDVHIMLSNPDVETQYLIYESDGVLNQSVDVAVRSAIAIYKLPFWHQVTPLIPRRGREREARRWLLLASFSIADASQVSAAHPAGAAAPREGAFQPKRRPKPRPQG